MGVQCALDYLQVVRMVNSSGVLYQILGVALVGAVDRAFAVGRGRSREA